MDGNDIIPPLEKTTVITEVQGSNVEEPCMDLPKTDLSTKSLLQACKQGDLERMRSLLDDDNVDVNIANDEDRSTCLHECSSRECQYVEITKLLLKQKHCNVNAQDINGKTPLHYAVLYYSFENIKLLLEYNAKANIKDRTGSTAIDFAVDSADEELIKLLVDDSEKLTDVLKLLKRKKKKKLKNCTLHNNLESVGAKKFYSPSILKKKRKFSDIEPIPIMEDLVEPPKKKFVHFNEEDSFHEINSLL